MYDYNHNLLATVNITPVGIVFVKMSRKHNFHLKKKKQKLDELAEQYLNKCTGKSEYSTDSLVECYNLSEQENIELEQNDSEFCHNSDNSHKNEFLNSMENIYYL